MKDYTHITDRNLAYWSDRSSGYSEVNKEELGSSSRTMWSEILQDRIQSHFQGRSSDTIRVLDIGTGPGFFAIILAELGYVVTAIDMTPEMLAEAQINAGAVGKRINFALMNAESLDFPEGSFDVIVSRNLTWNLPHPETAYREWHRVLEPGGLILNFDSNWYRYLFDEYARMLYQEDRDQSAALGLDDQNVGDHFDIMEEIAYDMPLSAINRPEWDLRVLSEIGLNANSDEQVWRRVWTKQEQVNFSSTPMFLISAVKPDAAGIV